MLVSVCDACCSGDISITDQDAVDIIVRVVLFHRCRVLPVAVTIANHLPSLVEHMACYRLGVHFLCDEVR
jgi:hypothetical protein